MSTQLATTNGVAPPASLDEIMRLGAVLAASGFFKETKNEAEAAAKIIVGAELGISPTAALRSVHVFNGQIALHYSLIAALIKRSGKYDYKVIERSPQACEIEFYEGDTLLGTIRKTMQEMDDRKVSMSWESKDRKWKKKFPWQAYPDTMLFARALTDGQRTYCPDVGNGPLYTPEELGDEAADIDEGNIQVEVETVPPALAPPTNGLQDYINRINELRAQILAIDPDHLFVIDEAKMQKMDKSQLTTLGKTTAAQLEALQAKQAKQAEAADPQMQQIDDMFPVDQQPKF